MPDIICLTLLLMYEPDNSFEGIISVLQATENRLQDSRWPSTVCGVVNAGRHQGRRDCHYSYMCDGLKETIDIYNYSTIEKMRKILIVVRGRGRNQLPDLVGKANHYYARYINPPTWSFGMKYRGFYGNHIFLEG